MFNRFTFSLGTRYALARGGSHLVSFISRMSVGGLIISVALLITVLSVMNGFDRELREQILQLMPQGVIYNQDGIENPTEIMAQIKRHPEVTAAAPFVSLEGLLNARGRVVPVQAYGVVPEQERQTSNIDQYLRGHRLDDLAGNRRAVILGALWPKSYRWRPVMR